VSRFRVTDAPGLALELALGGPPSWLIRGLWPADAYGVLGAEDKAGKTWAVLDLAVSVATGTRWLDHFEVEGGPVLAFLGEGGPRNIVRRLEAIAANRKASMDDRADLRLAPAVPVLSSAPDLADVRAELEDHPARLVIIEPLYLAAAGLKGSDLYAMGEALGEIQRICEEARAALVITTHWNKTGTGSDPSRFTGVGPTAWGRVLGSAAVERRATESDGTSDVLLHWTFRGGEIADTEFRLRRRIRALDPEDLASPFSYQVEVSPVAEGEAGAAGSELGWSALRVLAALEGADGEPIGVKTIGDAVAADGQGSPLRAVTIKRSLDELTQAGKADGGNGQWWSLAERAGFADGSR